jgi:site-specific DNA-methyltransferase (adenine-specific)
MKPYYEDQASGIVIYHGDCREVLRDGLPVGWSRPVVITDPPYKTGSSCVPIRGGGVSERIEESESVGQPWGYDLDWIESCAAYSPMHWVVFGNYQMIGGLCQRLPPSALFVWRKSNAARMTRPVPRLDCEFMVWHRHEKATCRRMGEFDSLVLDVPMPQAGCFASERILEAGTGKAAHPCQKPLAVVQPFVTRLADPSEFVLDPFAGTGTTLVAAKIAGQRAIGIEQKEEFCELAANRLRQGVLFGLSGGVA